MRKEELVSSTNQHEPTLPSAYKQGCIATDSSVSLDIARYEHTYASLRCFKFEEAAVFAEYVSRDLVCSSELQYVSTSEANFFEDVR